MTDIYLTISILLHLHISIPVSDLQTGVSCRQTVTGISVNLETNYTPYLNGRIKNPANTILTI